MSQEEESAVQYGFIYSASPTAELNFSEIGQGTDTIQKGSLSLNGKFYSEVAGLNFNTTYYFKSWAKTSSGTYYESEEKGEFRIRDGWVRSDDMPGELVYAFGDDLEDAAYMLGCQFDLQDCNGDVGAQALWECKPSTNGNDIQWTNTGNIITNAKRV